jgi:hypothetical protein
VISALRPFQIIKSAKGGKVEGKVEGRKGDGTNRRDEDDIHGNCTDPEKE